jgi:hypothetical protein
LQYGLVILTSVSRFPLEKIMNAQLESKSTGSHRSEGFRDSKIVNPFDSYSGPAVFRGVVGRDVRPRPKHILRFAVDEFLVPFSLCVLLSAQAVVGYSFARVVDPTRVMVDATLALLALMLLISRIVRAMPRLRILLGERTQSLQFFTALNKAAEGVGFVYHQVRGIGFEVDHVLVTPSGIFAISVEVIHQPAGHEASALFDGEFLHIEGAYALREPVARSKVVARCLADVIKEWAGFGYKVRPVLIIPGWTIHRPRPPGSESWACEPTEFLTYVARQNPVLEAEELASIKQAMGEVVRNATRREEYLKRTGQRSR